MDFRQFRYFITAAEELHFARAAEKLGIAQPALSQQIGTLERQLGARLFLRAKRRVELTEIGNVFLEEAKAAVEQADKALRVARSMARGEAGRIDIGLVGSAMYEPLFSRRLNAYRTAHPDVQIALHEMAIPKQIDALLARHIDIAIIRDPIPATLLLDTEHFPLSTQQLMAVLPQAHPLASGTGIHLRDLENDAFIAFDDLPGVGIGQALIDLCQAAGFMPKVTQKVSEVATLISLVAAGFGVGLVAEIVAHLRLPGVCYLPLVDTNTRSNLLVVQRRFEHAVPVRRLLDDLRENARPSSRPGSA